MQVTSQRWWSASAGTDAPGSSMTAQRRAPAPTGEVFDRGGAFAVCLGRSFTVGVDEVWRWLTEPERLRVWLGEPDPAHRRLRLAGVSAQAPEVSYSVERLVPQEHATLSLRDDGLLGEGAPWRVDVSLTSTAHGSHLMLEQAITDRVPAPSVAAACELYLDRLVRVCHREPLDDLDHDDYFLSQGATYRRMFPLPRAESGA